MLSDKLRRSGGAGATYKIEAIVSVDERGQMVFLHCNAWHHSLGLISGVKNPSDSSLHHVMVKVGEMNDVGRTHDLCIAEDVLFYRGLGRHSNDHMFSFYAYAPGRLAIKYEWNGRLLKDEEAWEVVMVGVSSFWGHGALGERPRGAI